MSRCLHLLCLSCLAGANLFEHSNVFSDTSTSLLDQYENCRNQVNSDFDSFSDDSDPEYFDVAGLRPNAGHQSVVAKKSRLWPAAQIPTKLEADFTTEQIRRLSCAIKYFRAYSCVEFIEWNSSYVDYLYITKTDGRKGCFSEDIGKSGGRQILNLDATDLHCWKHGTIVHELLHVLGFFHEQARDDRDQYIHVHWDHIPDQYEFQFKTASQLGIEQKLIGQYDYESIMHYGRFIWHLNNPTMTAKKDPSIQYKFNEMMGNRNKPTDMDTKKLNLLYCPEDKDCIVSGWLTEGQCTKSCGGGIQARRRTILKDVQAGGVKCPALEKTVPCNTQPCPIDCQVSHWSPKTQCSVSCEGGTQTLERTIVTPPNSQGQPCPALESVAQCNTHSCPRDCQYQVLLEMPKCSVTCGGGTKYQKVFVTQNATGDGKQCPTNCNNAVCRMQIPCNTQPCNADCLVSLWDTGVCSKSCGGGLLTETRTITQEPEGSGKECPSLTRLGKVECNTDPCPGEARGESSQVSKDCLVSEWSTGVCSKTCGGGYFIGWNQTRTIIQEPEGNGKECPSLTRVYQLEYGKVQCNAHPCPGEGWRGTRDDQDCLVSNWFYDSCSRSCGGGVKTERRTVTQHPEGNGQKCPPLTKETHLQCNIHPCSDEAAAELIDVPISPLNESYHSFGYNCDLIPHGNPLLKFVLIGVCGSLMILFGMLGNVTSIIIFCKPKLRIPNNYFLIALAVFDTSLLLCALLLFSVESIIEFTSSRTLQKVWLTYVSVLYGVSSISMTGSIYMTIAAAIERILPNCGRRLCTKFGAGLSIFLVVCFAVAFNVTKFLELKVMRLAYCEEDTFQAYIVMQSKLMEDEIYAKVFNLWMRSIVVTFLPFVLLAVLGCVLIIQMQSSCKYKAARTASPQVTKSNLKEATVVVIAVVTLFLICNILNVVVNFMEIFMWQELYESTADFYMFSSLVTNLLTIINSAVKFCIYCIFSKMFRQELVTVFCCGRLKNAEANNNGDVCEISFEFDAEIESENEGLGL